MSTYVSYNKPNVYLVYVTWVDHASYIRDERLEPSFANISFYPGRNLYVSGYRLDSSGDPFKYSIIVPQELQGSFKIPQPGDVIAVEESQRGLNSQPVYVYSIYNGYEKSDYRSSSVPEWGSIPGDYGHIRSHRDHAGQFSSQSGDSFTKKYIKSVTGYRFRKYYGHVYNTENRFLDNGKFVIRGDNVFDISRETSSMSVDEVKTEFGVDIVAVGSNSLENDPSRYPNPLNVPQKREQDVRYSYSNDVYQVLPKKITNDLYQANESSVGKPVNKYYSHILKVKNYFAYQPIVDRRYIDYLESVQPDPQGNKPDLFERELPAAEEYQVSLRGNNKLLIQDQYGNGEQIVITLKNQYDAGFSVIHNSENSQVRLRDHLGQGVLLEANPNAPRIVTWTTERQVIDMGSIRNHDTSSGDVESFGEYIYLRNGSVYGKSDTSFGRLAEDEIPRNGSDENKVPQQEFLLINAKTDSNMTKLIDGISSRLSSGMNSFIEAPKGSGLFFRNNLDPNESEQRFSIFNTFNDPPTLVARIFQEHQSGLNGKNIVSEFLNVVTDNESNFRSLNAYLEGGVESTAQIESLCMNDFSDITTTSSFVSPSGTATSTRKETNDSSESIIRQINMFVGESMSESEVRSSVGGNVVSRQTLEDLVNLNTVEIISTTQPGTRITHIVDGNPVNIFDMEPERVSITQNNIDGETISTVVQDQASIKNTFFSPPNTPQHYIVQEDASIELHRLVPSVSLNIGSNDVGAGTINIGTETDTIIINADSITSNANTIEENATVSIVQEAGMSIVQESLAVSIIGTAIVEIESTPSLIVVTPLSISKLAPKMDLLTTVGPIILKGAVTRLIL
jgi:hypothetical protein